MEAALGPRPKASAPPEKIAGMIWVMARRIDRDRHRLGVLFEDDRAQAAVDFSVIGTPERDNASDLLGRKLHFREVPFQRRQEQVADGDHAAMQAVRKEGNRWKFEVTTRNSDAFRTWKCMGVSLQLWRRLPSRPPFVDARDARTAPATSQME